MCRDIGITEEQLRDLSRFEESAAFTEAERAAMRLAVEMTRTPVEVPAALEEELGRHFDQAQLVELAATIAWEHYRARFNRVFGVRSVGFTESTGAFCALPEPRTADDSSNP